MCALISTTCSARPAKPIRAAGNATGQPLSLPGQRGVGTSLDIYLVDSDWPRRETGPAETSLRSTDCLVAHGVALNAKRRGVAVELLERKLCCEGFLQKREYRFDARYSAQILVCAHPDVTVHFNEVR